MLPNTSAANHAELLKRVEPVFISLEGGEGSGKSTQVKLLSQALEQAGAEVVATREPGGCPQAEELRNLLVRGEVDRWHPLSEAFIFSAARHEHVKRVIQPALSAGKWVVSDRFADSTTVYQGIAHGVARQDLETLHTLATDGSWPDLTFILDLPAAVGLGRSQGRLGVENSAETRMESMGLPFHERVRQGFLDIACKHPERCRVINAEQPAEDVAAAMLAEVMNFLKSRAA